MKNVINGLMLTASALFAAGLVSCQNETADINIPQNEGREIEVSLTAVIDGDDTRASLNTVEGEDVIKFSWGQNDKIYVINKATGGRIGILDAKVMDNKPKECKFFGTIKEPVGTCTLLYYYIGTKGQMTVVKDEEKDIYIPNDLTVNFSNQTGSNETFADYDILTGTYTYENGIQDHNLGIVNFNRYLSYGRFVLKIKDNGTEREVAVNDIKDAQVKISANTGDLYNKATINFKTGVWSQEKVDESNGDITLNLNGRTTNDFYLSFVPSDAVNLKFECTVNNESFVGNIMSSIKKNSYYTNDTQGSAIPVVMKRTDGSDDEKTFTLTYHQNLFAVGNDENQNYLEKKVVSETNTATEKEFTLVYENVGFKNTPKSKYYTFKRWSKDAKGVDNTVTGNSYTLSYNRETKNTTISDNLYAIYTVHYVVEFGKGENQIDDSMLPSKLTKDEESNKTLEMGTLDKDMKRDGYEFKGWKLKDSDDSTAKPFSEYTMDIKNPQIVLIPVWEKVAVPNTVSTSGYVNGTINM